jgi:hypothetical protein
MHGSVVDGAQDDDAAAAAERSRTQGKLLIAVSFLHKSKICLEIFYNNKRQDSDPKLSSLGPNFQVSQQKAHYSSIGISLRILQHFTMKHGLAIAEAVCGGQDDEEQECLHHKILC